MGEGHEEYRSKIVIHGNTIDIRYFGATNLTIKYEDISFKKWLKDVFAHGFRALMPVSTFVIEHPNYPTRTRRLCPGDELVLRHNMDLVADGIYKNKWCLNKGNLPLVFVYQGRKHCVTAEGDSLVMEDM